MKKLWPVLFLLIFPGIFAESVASANTPAVLFLNPKVLLTFCLIYGAPALLIRDWWVKGRLSAVGVIIMGAVYAAFNEGLVAASWFKSNPLNFTNIEAARAGVVNWHLVINLILFHTLFSILIPIILSHLVFREYKNQPLLSGAGTFLWALAVIFIALANVGHGTLAHPKFDLLILMVIAGVAAFLIKDRPITSKTMIIKQPLLAGLAYAILFTISYFVLPHWLPGKSVLLSLAFYLLMMVFTVRYLRSPSLLSGQTVLLIIGALIPAALISLTRLAFGQPVVVAACLVFLVVLLRRTGTKTFGLKTA